METQKRLLGQERAIQHNAGIDHESLRMLAAIMLRVRPRIAAQVGLAGSVLALIAYAPYIAVSVLSPLSTSYQVWFLVSHAEYVPAVSMVLAPLLLAACTVNSILSSKPQKMKSV